jgi:hypothetical protein
LPNSRGTPFPGDAGRDQSDAINVFDNPNARRRAPANEPGKGKKDGWQVWEKKTLEGRSSASEARSIDATTVSVDRSDASDAASPDPAP